MKLLFLLATLFLSGCDISLTIGDLFSKTSEDKKNIEEKEAKEKPEYTPPPKSSIVPYALRKESIIVDSNNKCYFRSNHSGIVLSKGKYGIILHFTDGKKGYRTFKVLKKEYREIDCVAYAMDLQEDLEAGVE